MSLAITGAAGQLGRRTAELILEAGTAPADLVLITRDPAKLADFAAKGIEVRAGDFDVPAGLPAAFEGVDRLLLISTDAVGRRVPQHTAAIDAAKQAGVGFIAYTSLVNCDTHLASLAPEHQATERYLRTSGVPYAVLRNALYSEFQVPTAAGALATGKFVTNAQDGRASYVSREDCAAVAAAVLRGPGHDRQVYEVTGPELIDADGLAQRFAAVGGKPVEVVQVDDEAYAAGLTRFGLPQPVADTLASFGRSTREGSNDLVSDVVERLTGRPAIPLADVLDAHREQLTAA